VTYAYPDLRWTSDRSRRTLSKCDSLRSTLKRLLDQRQAAQQQLRTIADPLNWTSQQVAQIRMKIFDDTIELLKAEKKLLESLLSAGESLIQEGVETLESQGRALETKATSLTDDLLKVAGLNRDEIDPILLSRYQHQARSLPNYRADSAAVDQIKVDLDTIRTTHRQAKERLHQIHGDAQSAIAKELGI
jgi:chaperonin cofactor prefoldin